MNFKTPFKVLTTAALIGTLSLSAVAPGAASAAEKTATSFQAKAELTASHVVLEDAKGNLITLDYNTYLEAKSVGIDLGAEPISIKVGDKFYHLNDFLEAKSVSNNDLAEAVKLLDENNLSQDITPAEGAIEDGKLVVVPGDEDFKVTEIAAINQTVDKAGILTFQINNNGEDITADKLPEGYTANFKASAGVFGENKTESTDGKVSAEAGTKFQFEVEIKDKEGKVVAKSERVTATVQDFAQTVVSIDKVTTTLGENDSKQEIKDGKLGLNETVQLKVEGKVKGNKDLQDFTNGVDPVAVVTIDKPAVLGFDKETGTLTAKAKGTATVTITVGDQTEKVTYTVGDVRKADKVVLSKNSVSLATGQEEKLTATVTDQYGLGYTGAMTVTNAPDVNVIATDGNTMTADAKEAGKYNITLTAADAAAKGDVVVAQEDAKVGIATIAVEVKAAKDEIKEYKLVATTDTKFDLKTEEGKEAKTVTLKGYDEQGLEVPAAKQPQLNGTAYKLVSKNENVATVENNTVTLDTDAKAGDKVVIEAVKVTGALEDTVATLEFTVVDSSPTIDDITITSATSVQTELAVDFTKLATVTASSPEGEVKVAYVATPKKSDTMNDNEEPVTANTLDIVEVNKDGSKGSKALGTVKFDPKVTVTVDEKTGKVVFANDTAGKTIIASYLVDDTFKGQVELKFETKSFADAEKVKANNKFLAYGLGEDAGQTVVDTSKVTSQKPSDLDTVAKFLKKQYGATFNKDNIKIEDTTATITGPLLSAEDFKKIKGDNPGEYRITMLNVEDKKDKVVKIAIKADGTAYFEAIPAK